MMSRMGMGGDMEGRGREYDICGERGVGRDSTFASMAF